MTREIENLRNVKITHIRFQVLKPIFWLGFLFFLASDICKLTYQ